jgi:hypothetical protein
MATESTDQKQSSPPSDQEQGRNDPAIDPDGKPQGQPDTQFEQNQQSGGNTFTPDYEPEEKPEVQRNPQPTRGEDADIETDGG